MLPTVLERSRSVQLQEAAQIQRKMLSGRHTGNAKLMPMPKDMPPPVREVHFRLERAKAAKVKTKALVLVKANLPVL